MVTDGELYAWGCNDYGQLGLGMSCGSVPVPSLVSSLTGVPFAFIASGGSHSFAISKSGMWFCYLNTVYVKYPFRFDILWSYKANMHCIELYVMFNLSL